MCFDTQQLGVCIFKFALWYPLLQLLLADILHAVHTVEKDVKQQSLPTAVSCFIP